MKNIEYDITNPISIEGYAKNLLGRTFRQVLDGDFSNEIYENKIDYGKKHSSKEFKGGLGNLIEEVFFHYKSNNDSRPDFPEAGVELKVTPYKINKNKTLSAKERLIITMIDYCEVINEDFYDSHVWAKCKLILLVYYLYSKEIENRLDYRINYVTLFTPPEKDIELIKNDYITIINKIKAGKAHELSDSDTVYLGAATKASTSKNERVQPFSSIKAKPRAFSFKNSYMTYVLNNYIVPNKTTYEPIIKDVEELNGKTFEEYIIDRINSYIGESDEELCKVFNREYNNNKAQWIDLSYRMLGIKSNQAEEFVKANIVVKAIRVEENNKIIESMSFPAFKFKELAEEDWEESEVFNYFDQTRFLFVIYKKQNDRYVLQGCKLWNMPFYDLNVTVRQGWENIRNVIKKGVQFIPKQSKKGIVMKNNFPKKGDNPIIHIRPHAQKSAYKLSDGTEFGDLKRNANELPDGQWMTTQSFWINNSYILEQIDK